MLGEGAKRAATCPYIPSSLRFGRNVWAGKVNLILKFSCSLKCYPNIWQRTIFSMCTVVFFSSLKSLKLLLMLFASISSVYKIYKIKTNLLSVFFYLNERRLTLHNIEVRLSFYKINSSFLLNSDKQMINIV